MVSFGNQKQLSVRCSKKRLRKENMYLLSMNGWQQVRSVAISLESHRVDLREIINHQSQIPVVIHNHLSKIVMKMKNSIRIQKETSRSEYIFPFFLYIEYFLGIISWWLSYSRSHWTAKFYTRNWSVSPKIFYRKTSTIIKLQRYTKT